MRFLIALLLAATSLAAALPAQAAPHAQAARPAQPQRQSGPPHAWLFGAWTGGLFPVLDGMAAQDCRTQPTVIFAQDVVGHAGLLVPGLVERVIETVRTTSFGAEFRFTPSPGDQAGFGCESSDLLHVARNPDGSISFPLCSAFPYPLQRCGR